MFIFQEQNELRNSKYACRDKTFVAFAVSTLLSDKRRVLSRQTRVCRDKMFVATKMLPVAAPAKDSTWHERIKY